VQVHAELSTSSAVNGDKIVRDLHTIFTKAKTSPVIIVGVS
jgi:hypothetical protein